MKSLDELKSNHVAVPVPDITDWARKFTGWAIWPDTVTQSSSSNPLNEVGMGLLLVEFRVASKRMFGWAAFFAALGIIVAILSAVDDRSMSTFNTVVGLIPMGIAAYQIGNWYLNRDLKVRVFREGLSITKKGIDQEVKWRDVAHVQEYWSKTISHGIYHHNHRIKITATDGKIIAIHQALDGIERLGGYVQMASADFLLPGAIETLRAGGICDFGAFKISRYGITHRKKILPWNEVKYLNVENAGTTIIKLRKDEGLLFSWALERGGGVLNLELFLLLTRWFMEVAKRPAVNFFGQKSLTKTPPGQINDDVRYTMLISKKEALNGTQRKLYVGLPGNERLLTIGIQAGVQSGTVHHFPGHGYSNIQQGVAGNLHVTIIVESGIPFPERLERFQVYLGLALLAYSVAWEPAYSSLDLLPSIVLATLAGGVGGALMLKNQRSVGAISGAIGCFVSFLIQIIYQLLMYVWFGRDTFLETELFIVMLISILPGIGLYIQLLNKRRNQNSSSLP